MLRHSVHFEDSKIDNKQVIPNKSFGQPLNMEYI